MVIASPNKYETGVATLVTAQSNSVKVGEAGAGGAVLMVGVPVLLGGTLLGFMLSKSIKQNKPYGALLGLGGVGAFLLPRTQKWSDLTASHFGPSGPGLPPPAIIPAKIPLNSDYVQIAGALMASMGVGMFLGSGKK